MSTVCWKITLSKAAISVPQNSKINSHPIRHAHSGRGMEVLEPPQYFIRGGKHPQYRGARGA